MRRAGPGGGDRVVGGGRAGGAQQPAGRAARDGGRGERLGAVFDSYSVVVETPNPYASRHLYSQIEETLLTDRTVTASW
jgi:hypothetical protein